MLNKFYRFKAIPTTIACLLVLGFYTMITFTSRGWVSWAFSVPPLIIILITAVARIHDITAMGNKWFFRRLGFTLSAMGAVTLLVAPLIGYSGAFPSWRTLSLYWGIALVWLTTPNTPPWWRYVSGEYKTIKKDML